MFDYKRMINSRSARLKILHMLDFIPDSWMLRLQYRIKTGRRLDLKNPRRYTEKLQWYKLYYRDPLMAQCADKYEVREYVKRQGYEHILNDLLGIYESPEEIDFDALPEQFVLKDTLGGGGNEVLICTDKEKFDISSAMKTMRNWIQRKGKHPGREWVYDGRPHRVIAEAFIPSCPEDGGLIDYKFFCFHGKCEYVYIIADRIVGEKAGFGIFTPDYQKLPAYRVDEWPLKREVPKPIDWEEMLQCAEILSRPFPHARIDLYNPENTLKYEEKNIPLNSKRGGVFSEKLHFLMPVDMQDSNLIDSTIKLDDHGFCHLKIQNRKFIFGEFTFFDGSGYMIFEPDKFDFLIGEKLNLQ